MIENSFYIPILSLLIFIPLAGVGLIAIIPPANKNAIRFAALGVAGLNMFLSLTLLFGFDPSTYKMQFVDSVPWIPEIGVTYIVGIDGMSLLLLLLTTFIAVVSVACSWSAVEK